jgi:uncharacterized protein (TIGR02145 family)
MYFFDIEDYYGCYRAFRSAQLKAFSQGNIESFLTTYVILEDINCGKLFKFDTGSCQFIYLQKQDGCFEFYDDVYQPFWKKKFLRELIQFSIGFINSYNTLLLDYDVNNEYSEYYCGSIKSCGDKNIDYSKLLSQPISDVKTIEDFQYYMTSELIDAKSRKTLSGYPTLRGVYDRYLNSSMYCSTVSSAFNYEKIDQFAKLIDSYWVDIVEQVVPATTIWGSVKIYGNTIFDEQKFTYRKSSLFTCVDKANSCTASVENLDWVNNCIGNILDKFYFNNCGPIPYIGCQEYNTYGLLYNWNAVSDVLNISNPYGGFSATTAWHVPSNSEWGALQTYLGGFSVAGGFLKATGTTETSDGCWATPNTDAVDTYGFTALPSGYRDFSDDSFKDIGIYGIWWSSTEDTPTNAFAIYMDNFTDGLNNSNPDKKNGVSVRLVRDADATELLLPDGTNSGNDSINLRPYAGNDGRVYRTVKIGTQIWLANNLMETKYNDGSDIPEVITTYGWGTLPTAGRCIYSPIPEGLCNLFSCDIDAPITCETSEYRVGAGTIEFLDEEIQMPTCDEISTWGSPYCGCNYSSYEAVKYSHDLGEANESFGTAFSALRDSLKKAQFNYTDKTLVGFCSGDTGMTPPNVNSLNYVTSKDDFYYAGKLYQINTPKDVKAYLLPGWTLNQYPLHSQTIGQMFSATTDDIKYLRAVVNPGTLPVTGNAGDIIVSGTPSSYIGYAWDPISSIWSSDLYTFIDDEILTERRAIRSSKISAKNSIFLSMKPFTYSNYHFLLHPIKLWALQNATPVTGQQMIDTSGENLPSCYVKSADLCVLTPFCGPYLQINNNVC